MPDPTITAAINDYESGSTRPARWLQGLSPSEIDSHPIPNTWSIREVAVHILDSDLAATHRMRRIASEDTPLLIAYDETAFAKNLRYDAANLTLVTDLFAMHRTFTAGWLRTLPTEAFARVGIHNQRGKVSLAEMIDMYVNHLAHHEKFVVAKRAALGKPM
jgi:uncharacterized damage-inducible protein DinB